MANSLSYPPPHPHMATQFYAPTHSAAHSSAHNNIGMAANHMVAPPSRLDPTQRKRPKYTRSKTGCMTCRVKKIKCDEAKPKCMRCTHGQRDCIWPEGVPARKKTAMSKEITDAQSSTSGASRLSGSATPPTRDHTPPRRHHAIMSRRYSEPYTHSHPPPQPIHRARVNTMDSSYFSSGDVLYEPEIPRYSARYDNFYSGIQQPAFQSGALARASSQSTTISALGQDPWNQLLPTVHSLQPFFSPSYGRSLVVAPAADHARYQ